MRISSWSDSVEDLESITIKQRLVSRKVLRREWNVNVEGLAVMAIRRRDGAWQARLNTAMARHRRFEQPQSAPSRLIWR